MRFYALDVMRFGAALAVVLYHFTYRPETGQLTAISGMTKFGYLGVPLFFIISGFVICASAQNRSPLGFAVSRFARLFPAYWVGVSITAITVLAIDGGGVTLTQYLANLTMLNDYLGIQNIDEVYWTLHAEIKFYACVFLLLVSGVFHRYKTWLTIWLGLVLAHMLFMQPFFLGWFISPSYSALFISGIVFFLLRKDGWDWHYVSILAIALGVASMNTIVQAEAFLHEASAADKTVAMLLVWSFYGIFALLVMGRLEVRHRRSLLILGGLTYPMYLIHGRAGKAFIDEAQTLMPEYMAIILAVVLVAGISVLIHFLVERRYATPLKKALLTAIAKLERLPKSVRAIQFVRR